MLTKFRLFHFTYSIRWLTYCPLVGIFRVFFFIRIHSTLFRHAYRTHTQCHTCCHLINKWDRVDSMGACVNEWSIWASALKFNFVRIVAGKVWFWTPAPEFISLFATNSEMKARHLRSAFIYIISLYICCLVHSHLFICANLFRSLFFFFAARIEKWYTFCVRWKCYRKHFIHFNEQW